jgi:hypothetical protein
MQPFDISMSTHVTCGQFLDVFVSYICATMVVVGVTRRQLDINTWNPPRILLQVLC